MFSAMGPPMTPSPTNPTFILASLTSVSSTHLGPLIHFPDGPAAQIAHVGARELASRRLAPELIIGLLHQWRGALERLLHLHPVERGGNHFRVHEIFRGFEHCARVAFGGPGPAALIEHVVLHDL